MNRRPFGISGALTVGEEQPEPKLVDVAGSCASAIDASDGPELSLCSLRAQAEIKAIESALKRTAWNRKQAARLLSISYRGLLYKIRRYNILPGVEHS
jgi:transcriptional regulator with GAF, ATPase, and Fis domain